MPHLRALVLAATLVLGGAAPQSARQIVDAAPPAAWHPIAAADLLVMTLADGRRIVMQLAPGFAPVHVANIRRLAQAGWWDHAAIVRAQDNYVVQWASSTAHASLPPGVVARPPAEYERAAVGLVIRKLSSLDSYAPVAGFEGGWPVASDGKTAWLVHCYGMVGVGRDLPPDTGDGSELYAVIGQAPRHLDRNIALIGRVVDGMAILASLPRGTADLGFYARPSERIGIRSVSLAADLPPKSRPSVEVLDQDAPAFAAYLDARANRRDAFFVKPAGAVDVCNAPVPTRLVPD